MTWWEPRLTETQEDALTTTWAYSQIEGAGTPCFGKRTVNSLERHGLATAHHLHGRGAYMELTEFGQHMARQILKRRNHLKKAAAAFDKEEAQHE